MPVKDPITCAGCGKSRAGSHRFPHIRMPDGSERYVCPGRSAHFASERCSKLAIEKARMCPGCGEEGETEPGFLCKPCQEALKTARAYVPQDVAWYSIDARAWVPSTYGGAGWGARRELGLDLHGKYPEEFVEQLITAWASGQQLRNKHELSWDLRSGVKKIEPPKYKSPYSDSDHVPVFQATPKQVEAMREVLQRFLTLLNEQRLTGRKEGRSLLVGLAEGKISPNEWDEQNKKLEALDDADETDD